MTREEIEVGQIWIFNETGLESKIISFEDEEEICFEYQNALYITDRDYLLNTHKLKEQQ